MKLVNLFSIVFAATVLFTSCDKDDDKVEIINKEMSSSLVLDLNISGLENLGPDYVYEGWLIVNGAAVTAGIFTVNDEGELSKKSFELDEKLATATAYVLTIEPAVDPDPKPSKVHILGGDISGTSSSLSVSHASALGTDFSASSGKYILATPTDGSGNNERSGVWFLDPRGEAPVATLNLPTLPKGWEYEGWAVINGVPVTTGKFTDVSKADMSAPFSGEMAGPPFPGEDFLKNAPAGLSFPTDLSEAKIVISVEPVPDNSTKPFLLKPLLGDVPMSAATHTPLDLGNISANTNPTGSVKLSVK